MDQDDKKPVSGQSTSSDTTQSESDANQSPANANQSPANANAEADSHTQQAQATATQSTQENTTEPDPWTQNEAAGESASVESAKASGLASGKSEAGVDLSGENWERDVLNRLAFATLNEQRRARRWSILFRALAAVYILFITFMMFSDFKKAPIAGGKHTALIDVKGVISADSEASADSIASALRAAFKNKNTQGIILRINSPGGSPVQANYVYQEIKRLRAKYTHIKLYAVIEDVCASGGYFIAAAADEIYADKASIVGSIGVLMNGFGFVDAMKKLGVERRLLTAGEHKGVLDPFSPLNKKEVSHVQGMLDGVHQQFIDVVKEGRGDRLKDHPDLFTGLFWNGEEGLELGLVDGFGSSGFVAREIIGEEKIVDYTPRVNYLDRFADRLGASIASFLMTSVAGQAPQLQ